MGVVAQDLRGQQQRGDVQIRLDACIGQTGHQCRSLAARNALAICTGVIVFRTMLPTSHLMKDAAKVRRTKECPVVRFIYPKRV
ncbi:hypothetical protein EJA71_15780 [Pseudomonas sp. PB106]|nr:hypothetical protein EJA71_15780 [Pseudomonas sp. PB106]